MTRPTFDKEEFIFKYTILSATTAVVMALAIAAILTFFTDASRPDTVYDFAKVYTNILTNSLNLALSAIIGIVAIDATSEARSKNGVPLSVRARMYDSDDYKLVASVEIIMGTISLYAILCIGNVDTWAANAFGGSITAKSVLVTWIIWISVITAALKFILMALRKFYYSKKV